jgi:hypothetical protein
MLEQPIPAQQITILWDHGAGIIFLFWSLLSTFEGRMTVFFSYE